jgi:Kef-type K+ transport system membrane component KefB
VLQCTKFGQFLATKRTWLTVVIGVGIDLLLGLWVVNFEDWLKLLLVITLSSIGIISRSLMNEERETKRVIVRVLETVNDSTTENS